MRQIKRTYLKRNTFSNNKSNNASLKYLFIPKKNLQIEKGAKNKVKNIQFFTVTVALFDCYGV